MSAENGRRTRPCWCCWRSAPTPPMTCGSCGICRYCSKVSSAALEERAQDLARGVWILRCSTSRASLNLDACRQQAKHGGVAEPIRRYGMLTRRGRKEAKTKGFAISDWKKCADRLSLPRGIELLHFSDAQYLRTCLKADSRAWVGH
jgi:hypothetical protein